MTTLRRRLATLTCAGALVLPLGGLATPADAGTTTTASGTAWLASLSKTRPGLAVPCRRSGCGCSR